MILGCAYGYGGMPEDGLHHLALASRLSPRDFTRSGHLSTCGLCHFVAGRFAEAVDFERRAVELNPDFGTAWRTYAASAGMAGRREEAAKALKEAKRLHPTLSVAWVEDFHPIVKASDRAAARIRFTPAILPPYARRSKSLDTLIPVLYLKGVPTGDFAPALAALLGKDAPGLSATTIARLKDVWIDEHKRWSERDLSAAVSVAAGGSGSAAVPPHRVGAQSRR
jgi:tetratricopeptide (TPR) repeat protein